MFFSPREPYLKIFAVIKYHYIKSCVAGGCFYSSQSSVAAIMIHLVTPHQIFSKPPLNLFTLKSSNNPVYDDYLSRLTGIIKVNSSPRKMELWE